MLSMICKTIGTVAGILLGVLVITSGLFLKIGFVAIIASALLWLLHVPHFHYTWKWLTGFFAVGLVISSLVWMGCGAIIWWLRKGSR